MRNRGRALSTFMTSALAAGVLWAGGATPASGAPVVPCPSPGENDREVRLVYAVPNGITAKLEARRAYFEDVAEYAEDAVEYSNGPQFGRQDVRWVCEDTNSDGAPDRPKVQQVNVNVSFSDSNADGRPDVSTAAVRNAFMSSTLYQAEPEDVYVLLVELGDDVAGQPNRCMGDCGGYDSNNRISVVGHPLEPVFPRGKTEVHELWHNFGACHVEVFDDQVNTSDTVGTGGACGEDDATFSLEPDRYGTRDHAVDLMGGDALQGSRIDNLCGYYDKAYTTGTWRVVQIDCGKNNYFSIEAALGLAYATYFDEDMGSQGVNTAASKFLTPIAWETNYVGAYPLCDGKLADWGDEIDDSLYRSVNASGLDGHDIIDPTGGSTQATAANAFCGGDGDDWIYGKGNTDTLVGGAGRDYMDGGAANDVFYDGPGKDTILGGSGTDTLYYCDDGLTTDIVDSVEVSKLASAANCRAENFVSQ